jgi:imidazoleglycerol phosphate dehydratase HisB
MKLRGTILTNKNSISRLSTDAIHSTLDNLNHVSVNTTLGESGAVSLRIEVAGKVALNEHWTIEDINTLLANRAH